MAGFTQFERGVHPRDLADPDANSMDDELSECRNPDCGLLHHDGPGGCCSTACAMEDAGEDGRDDGRTTHRDDHRAAQGATR